MLQLYIDNEAVDLNVDTSITIEYNSPFFQGDTQTESYSYPIDVPMTDRNKRIFRHKERVGVVNNKEAWAAKLYHDGLLIADGTAILVYPVTTEKSYRLSILVEAFAFAIKDKKLRDFNYGGNRIPNIATNYTQWYEYVAQVNAGTIQTDHVFPVIHLPKHPSAIANNGELPYANYTMPNGNNEVPGRGIFIPCAKVMQVLQQICLELGWAFTNTMTELDSLVIVPNVAKIINGFNGGVDLTAIDSFYLADYLPDMGVGEFINTLRKSFNATLLVDGKNKKLQLVANTKLLTGNTATDWNAKAVAGHEVVEHTVEDGYTFSWATPEDEVDEQYLNNALVDLIKNYAQRKPFVFQDDQISFFKYRGERDAETIEIISDNTDYFVNDIILATKSNTLYYCAYSSVAMPPATPPDAVMIDIYTNAQYAEWVWLDIKFSQWKALQIKYKGAYDNVSSIPAGVLAEWGDCAYIKNIGCYYVILPYRNAAPPALPVSQYALHYLCAHKLESLVVGNGVKEIKPNAAPLIMKELRQPLTQAGTKAYNWRVPQITQPLINDNIRTKEDGIALRWLCYRGSFAYEAPGIGQYINASNDTIHYKNGTTRSGLLNLKWEGSPTAAAIQLDANKGVYERYYKEWIDFLSRTKKISKSFALDATDLQSINFQKRYLIYNQVWLLSKLSVAYSMKGISIAKAELYKV
jgi:hypothetical protein